jgi:hypothetical protein
MNEERRIKIKSLTGQIDSLVRELVSVSEAEKAAFDRTPPGLQYGERGRTRTRLGKRLII